MRRLRRGAKRSGAKSSKEKKEKKEALEERVICVWEVAEKAGFLDAQGEKRKRGFWGEKVCHGSFAWPG